MLTAQFFDRANARRAANPTRKCGLSVPLLPRHRYAPAQGKYIKAWVEESRDVGDVQCVWQLWKLPDAEKKKRGIGEPLVRINWNQKRGYDGRGHSRGRGGGRGAGSRFKKDVTSHN